MQLATPTTPSFVGRGDELDSLRRVVSSGVRLVSLVGPPGAGKTRLATEFCRSSEHALFVDLTDARSEADLIRKVATVLDVPAGDSAPLEQLGWALSDAGPIVLVLDNCEQIVDAARRAISLWLKNAETSFLITSRQAIGLPAEIRISLGPLSEQDAIALFEQRARAILPEFRVGAEDRETVAELLTSLDNLPLVIELAAARVNVLPPAQLLKRLSDRLSVVKDVGRSTARQASLRGAIDWSWEMLDQLERRALARASVFRGGFSLEAAESLLGVDSPIDTLEKLVEKSLVRRSRSRRDAMDVRFTHYESVRLYAEEKLSEEDRQQLQAEHARWYAERASDWVVGLLEGADAQAQVEALDRVSEEYANLWAAMQIDDVELRAALAIALDAYLEARGPTASRREVLDRVGPVDDPDLRVRVQIARGLARLACGEVEDAAAIVMQVDGTDSSVRLQSKLMLARSRIARARGDLAEAKQTAIAATELAEQDDAWHLEALGRANFAAVAFDAPAQASAELRRALELAARSDDARLQLQLRNLAGTLAMNAGDPVGARAHFERALAPARNLGDHRVVAALLSNVALADHYSDQLHAARQGFNDAAALFRRVGLRSEAAIAAGNLAAVEVDLGEHDAALDTVHEALEAIGEADGHAEGIILATTGNLYHVRDDLPHAIQLYDQALERLPPGAPHRASTRVYRALARLQQCEDEPIELQDEKSGQPIWDYAATALRALRGGPALGEPPPGLPGQLRTGAADLRQMIDGNLDVEPRWLFARLVAQWLKSETHVPIASSADLIIDSNGYWFRVDGERVDIRRRGPARLLLLALAEDPGTAFNLTELFEIGWPGQAQIDSEAADKRVYAAIGTLRKLGLSDLLITTDEGYLIDPAARVVLEGS